MPHSTSASHSAGSHMRAASRSSTTRSFVEPNGASTSGQGGETEKFPDFDAGTAGHALPNGQQSQRWPQNGYTNGNGTATKPLDRWQARRDSRVKWAPGHGRQASITNAVHRMRSASMSQNAHEIAEALRAPVSWKLIVRLCPWILWEQTLPMLLDTDVLSFCCRPFASCGTGRRP